MWKMYGSFDLQFEDVLRMSEELWFVVRMERGGLGSFLKRGVTTSHRASVMPAKL